jgi:2-polyprenyl-6-methoxyphenol hydroxylase-like FAD-dependent oxidoreductase
MTGKNTIIVGGGIAGLATTIALERHGFEIELFEAAPKLEPVGFGIWMAPNAMQVFDRLAIAKEIETAGRPLLAVKICDQSFREIQVSDLTAAEKEFGFRIVAIHRGLLQETLLSKLKSTRVVCGSAFEAFELHEQKVIARFQNGKTVSADLLIGADGIHSKVRSQLLGNKDLRYSGLTCWRGVTDFDLPQKLKAISFELWGRRSRFGFSEISDKSVYWYAVIKSPPGKMETKETIRDKVIEHFQEFASPVIELIETTDSAKMIQTDLYDLSPFRPWVKGNIALIGDAAHPMTPNLGQGGAQAVVDAYVISEELARERNISQAMQIFEERRFKKVQKIVNDAYFFGKLAHIESGAGLRNAVLRMIPGSITQRSMHAIYRLE